MACHACFIRIHEVREHLLLLLNCNLQTARKTNAFLILTYFVLKKSSWRHNLAALQHFRRQKNPPKPTAAVGKLSTNCFGNQKVLTVKHDVKERHNTLTFLRRKKKRLPATK